MKWKTSIALSVLAVALAAPVHADEIDAFVKAYRVAYNDRDVKAMTALYAPQVVFLGPESDFAGVSPLPREAIEASWTRLFKEAGSLKTKIQAREVSADLANVVLDYHSRDYSENGTIVLCLKRQTSGRWSIVTEVWKPGKRGPGVYALQD